MATLDESKYIPSTAALEFIAFVRAAGLEEHPSPEAHYKIADALFSKDKADRSVLIECLRGFGKSTVIEYAVCYVAALGTWPNFGKTPFILFLGASQEGNVKQFFKKMGNRVAQSPFLSSILTVKRQTDSEIELVNKDGYQTTIVGKGMNVNFRGISDASSFQRPTAVIADDVMGNDVMRSEAIRQTIETNWYNSVLPALATEKQKKIFIGTPLSEDDLLAKIKNSGTFKNIKFPLCEKFPCAEEEFKSIWPSKFTYEYTRDMYENMKAGGKTQSFYQEYMLEVTDLATLLVEEDDIQWYDYSTFHMNKNKYNYYVVTDFATSTKKSADFSVIGVIALSSNNDWLLVDGQCKRQTMQENLEDLFKYVAKWSPMSVGIESSGQQGGFISILQDMMIERNCWFQFGRRVGSKEAGIRPIKDKVHRFVTGVQPLFKQGRIWLPKPETLSMAQRINFLPMIDELINELSKFTMAGGVNALAHDDCIDILNQMSEMETYRPSNEADMVSDLELEAQNTAYWSSLGEDEEDSFSSVVF